MGSFLNTFGGSAVSPADVAFSAFSFSMDTQLYWPAFANNNPNIAARFMNVAPAAPNLNLILPDATLVSVGQDVIVNNTSGNSFTLGSYGGTTIGSITPGTQWYAILTDNSTQAGTWFVLQFGAGVSEAQASSLAGYGLSAIGSLLNLNYTTSIVNTSFIITAANRATVFVWTGGSGTATLPNATAVGAGFSMALANNGSGNLVATPVGGQQIDGASTSTFSQSQSGFIVSDGAAWHTVGKGTQTNFAVTLLNKNVAGSANVTLTSAEAQNIIQQYTGVLTGNINVIVPSTVQLYFAANNTTGAFTLIVKTASGTGVGVAQGGSSILYCDGTNVVPAFTYVPAGAQQYPAGSATSPSLSFQTGPDSGFYSPASHVVGVSAAGFEVMRWTSQASAVNEFQVQATATGVDPNITAFGSDANINLSLVPKGTGGVKVPAGAVTSPSLLIGENTTGLYLSSTGAPALAALGFYVMGWTTQASPVNGFAVLGTATGNGPQLSVLGTDTNINMVLVPKGTGAVVVPTGLAATPSLLIGEAGTGFWRPSAGVVAISVAGTEVSRWTAAAYQVTPGITLSTNNTFIKQADSGAVIRQLMGLDGSNVLQVGGTGVASINLNAALSGTPTAPTAAAGTNTGQLATTAFVQAALPILQPTVLTSGSGTYNVPVGTTYLRVRGFGGGAYGTGGGGVAGTQAGSTSFGTAGAQGNATGGSGSNSSSGQSPGGAGGIATNGTINVNGAPGIGCNTSSSQISLMGGNGGNGPFGGGGIGGNSVFNNGTSASANSGAGGGGGVGNASTGAGPGGGAGAYFETYITTPAASYAYVVGAAGGSSTGTITSGGAGAAGILIIEAY